MFYAILAYHVEEAIKALTPQEDAALMAELLKINTRLHESGSLGPSARLGATEDAFTLRGPGDGMIIDGPFAETKEQFLGFYVADVDTIDEAVDFAKKLSVANPGPGAYEIRPLRIYLPSALPDTVAV